ncbi:alpha/beta hydrolase [Azoarcus sp. PA01]|nr:alpha/beta hydrolase [Azoarcus sp. PA01]
MKLRHTTISIPAERVWLDGELSHAPTVQGLAVILRPSGSTPTQSREAKVAAALQEAGFATLIINLLTRYEETRDADARFNVPKLANRVLAVADWIGHQPPLTGLAIGLLASGTASGAAIRAAWKAPGRFAAIVCRAGRPDLAGATPLGTLTVPVRMIIGSEDLHLGMILRAWEHLRAPRDWKLVDGAGEDFAEPGALERFALLAAEWLRMKLLPPVGDGVVRSGQPDKPASSHPL